MPQATPFVEEPLTLQEVAQLKQHFRFLREHRNVLKLRVNAAEDLLLNGVKEPTHRGLCQHLLAKVERSRVLSVSQTMPPADAVRLLGGIIRFTPEIGYILRYLECVKQTASQHQAGAALTVALNQIDYAELSEAQTRQLVALIVDVFAERDLPVFLFTLLYDKSFKAALDRSLDGFPAILESLVRPLRALHEAIARRPQRRPNGDPPDLANVKAGVSLLLDVNPLSLDQLPEPARRRLYHLGCETLRVQSTVKSDVLGQLLSNLTFPNSAEKISATLDLVSAMLAAGHDGAAKKLLDRECSVKPEAGPEPRLARWREALEAPRMGSVALEPGRSKRDLPPPGRWYRGWHLPTQSPVLARHGEPTDQGLFAEQTALLRGLLVPGVCRIVDAQVLPNQRPYLALELPGHPLQRETSQTAEATRLRWAVELCAVLAAMARAGVVLKDADLHRFNSDEGGRLWLVDCWPLEKQQSEQALLVHCELAKKSCHQLLLQGPCYALPPDANERLERATSLLELVQLFETRS